MKTLILALLLLAPNAFAADTPVRAASAKPLYEAMFDAFPSARESFNHSMSVLVTSLACESSNEGVRCEAKTINGENVALEHSVELLTLLDAMEEAGIPAREFKGGEPVEIVNLEHLACDRNMPSDGEESYECGFASIP